MITSTSKVRKFTNTSTHEAVYPIDRAGRVALIGIPCHRLSLDADQRFQSFGTNAYRVADVNDGQLSILDQAAHRADADVQFLGNLFDREQRASWVRGTFGTGHLKPCPPRSAE